MRILVVEDEEKTAAYLKRGLEENGFVVDVASRGDDGLLMVRAERVEVRRLVVPAGKEIAEHKAKGEIIVQCLEGRVAFTAFGKTHNLEAGKLLYLPTGEPYTVKGVEDASLPLTVLLPKH
jgi:quercetin dioxygenase-like cupin family protein